MLEESARISRGVVKDIKELKADPYDALVIPGGSGVAKNLCNYVLKGANFKVDPSVEAVLKEFAEKKKHLALCCIAPVIAAKVFGSNFGGPGVEMTMGKVGGKNWPYSGGVEICRKMGNSMVLADSTEFCVDKKIRLYTTPWYDDSYIENGSYLKGDAKACEVFEGIDNMITQMAKDIREAAA